MSDMICSRLRELRRKNGYTQSGLANIKEFYEDPEAGCYNIKRAIKQIGFDDNIGDIMDTLAVHDDLKAKLSRIKK